RHERYLNLIPLIWPAVLALLLVILLQAASRSRALVIVVYIAVAIWLAVLVLCSRTGVPSWVVAGFDGHEMAGIQGQNLVMVGSHQADRGGADHEDVDEGASLCFGKEGAQDQGLV